MLGPLGIVACCQHPVNVPPVTEQPAIGVRTASRLGAEGAAGGEPRLLAYVSPVRRVSWALPEAAGSAAAQANLNPGSVQVVAAAELARLVETLEPLPGDSRYWADATCMSSAFMCVTDCTDIGGGIYRQATTFNSTGCVYQPGSTCWDNFGKRCVLRYFSDPNCSDEIPNTEGSHYDAWVCGASTN